MCKMHKANGNPRWGHMSLAKSDGRKRAAMTEDMKLDLEQREEYMGSSIVVDKKTGERFVLCGGFSPDAVCTLCGALNGKKPAGAGWAAMHPEKDDSKTVFVCFECLSQGFSLEKREER